MGTNSNDHASDAAASANARAMVDAVEKLNHRTVPGMMADLGHTLCAAVLPASVCAPPPVAPSAPKKSPGR